MNLYSAVYQDFHPFSKFYPQAKTICINYENASLENPGILIIWGGGDIHPCLYDRENLASCVGKTPSKRDQIEVSLVSRAIEISMPIIGVCRGAQLVCAAAGGILVQDVDNHNNSHLIETSEGDHLITSSIHHQMMYPWRVAHEILAWSIGTDISLAEGLTSDELETWPTIPNTIKVYEPEVVWFPQILALAIQGHPEYMEAQTPFNKYVHSLCEAYIIPNLVNEE